MTRPFQLRPFHLSALLLALPLAQAQVAPQTTPTPQPALVSPAPPAANSPLTALPSLDVPAYMGTWYQVAWFPNRFQSQCASDTTASYRQLPGGHIEVINRCRRADGAWEDVMGAARPAGATLAAKQLQPAQLEVSFLPKALRWLPIWGTYWVIQLADDGRYAVVSEPKLNFLWVLSRTPQLQPADQTEIRSRLVQQGFDLSRWQLHPHSAPAATPS